MSIDPREFEKIVAKFDNMSRDEREELLDRLEERRLNLAAVPSGGSALEGFRKRGFLGSIKDAPADLSTNRKYMEGFGRDTQ
ncbi:MAG: hypothetical protein ACOC7K_01085 [bacterium]